MPETAGLVLSVVSHGHGSLLPGLLGDLARHAKSTAFRLILTENVPEAAGPLPSDYPFPIEVVRNERPKGFGANHNAALARAGSGLLCVLNPDIRLPTDPFPVLEDALRDRRIGVAGPLVTDSNLVQEDHARDFPSVFTLIGKTLGRRPHVEAPPGQAIYFPDWIAGMFMVGRCDTLRSVGGFDERYFLYYEDVDLCARLREAGFRAAVCTGASVIHAARRQSRRNLRFTLWHLRSAARFFARRPRIAFGLGSANR